MAAAVAVAATNSGSRPVSSATRMPIHSATTVTASVARPMRVVGSVRPEPLMMVPAMLNSEKKT